MKKLLLSLLFLVLPAFSLFTGAQEVDFPADTTLFRRVNNQAFQAGEVLKFRLHYGFINAGVSELRVKPQLVSMASKNCYHIVATGRSISSFDWIYKVRDSYETYIDRDALIPWAFVRDINEGGFIMKDYYAFDHYQKKVVANGTTFSIPRHTQDIVSSFYYARTIDFSNAKPGDVFEVPLFLDNEVHRFKFKFAGRAILKTDVGKFRVMKFMPVVMKGRVFKNEEDLIVYVSDDENKIPLEIKANILVGAIKMSITGYEGLKNPMTSKIN